MIRPLQVIHVNPNCRPDDMLTSFGISSDGTKVAIGYASGIILMFIGYFYKEGSLGKQQYPIQIRNNDNCRINALHFCELPLPANSTSTIVNINASTKLSTNKQNSDYQVQISNYKFYTPLKLVMICILMYLCF